MIYYVWYNFIWSPQKDIEIGQKLLFFIIVKNFDNFFLQLWIICSLLFALRFQDSVIVIHHLIKVKNSLERVVIDSKWNAYYTKLFNRQTSFVLM